MSYLEYRQIKGTMFVIILKNLNHYESAREKRHSG